MTDNEECIDCNTYFKTIKQVLDHKKYDNMCKRYKNIVFSCQCCNFTTKGFINIETHILKCSSNIDEKQEPEKDKKDIDKKDTDKKDTDKKETKKEKPTGEIYRKVNEKSGEKITEEELQSKIKIITADAEESIERIICNNFDISSKEIYKNIEELFTDFDKETNRTKINITATKIRDERNKLLGKISYDKYITLINNHIQKVDSISSKFEPNKIINIKEHILSPLDMRLILFGKFILHTLDIDNVIRFKKALEVTNENVKFFTVFNKEKFYSKITNYNVCLSDIIECVKISLINIYGYYNIVYIDLAKTNKEYPHSFYMLTKIDTHRNWKLESRLEDFTNDFITYIRPYCIGLFRRMYKDEFSDNIYREDFIEKSKNSRNEFEQLLYNIILLCKPHSFCIKIQNLIKDCSPYKYTDMDKINLTTDDRTQLKRFSTTEDNIDEISTILSNLFDDITSENTKKLISNYDAIFS